MFKCEKCGREFENNNQEHFCGNDFTTIDEYIAAQPENIRTLLESVRAAIRSAAPDSIEKISWKMPTFWQGENIIHFAAFKKHLGVYPGDLTLTPFTDDLVSYKTTKGAIQFPYDKPVPFDLIKKITKYRVNAAQENQNIKKQGKKKEK